MVLHKTDVVASCQDSVKLDVKMYVTELVDSNKQSNVDQRQPRPLEMART